MIENIISHLSIQDNGVDKKEDFCLALPDNGVILAGGQSASLLTDLVAALNKLKSIDDDNASTSLDINDTIVKELCKEVSANMDALPSCQIKYLHIQSLLQVIALVHASYELNELIMKEMSNDLIDKILGIYLDALYVLKHLPKQTGNLLSRVSFISPLLITISFSFKIQYPNSPSLLKVLSLIFAYHLKHRSLLVETMKLFSFNGITNLEVFEVFNKLWEKTLEAPGTQGLDPKFAPGPLTLTRRLEAITSTYVELTVVDQILPYSPNQGLLKLTKDTVTVYNCLSSLNPQSGIKDLLPIVNILSSTLDQELVLCLAGTLGLQHLLISLHQIPDLKDTMNFIFFHLGNCAVASNSQVLFTNSMLLTADIYDAFNSSKYARYKAVFELVDHNYKIDFTKDYQMVMAIEGALSTINSDFSLAEDHKILFEFGSTFSIDSLFNYTTSIISTGLLKFVSPFREIPTKFTKTMSLERFAPLPRSNFLGFKFINNTFERQINLRNFDRLVSSAHTCLEIMGNILEGYTHSNDRFRTKDSLFCNDANLQYCANHVLLEQYFTTLFTVLILAHEMMTRGEGRTNNMKSSVVYDYMSIGNVLKLQVFQLFTDLFQLYGSFGAYELVQFIEMVSHEDLEMQRIGVVLLNHLIFHSSEDFKKYVVENGIINKKICTFVKYWDDGSTLYTPLLDLLKIGERKEFTVVVFEKQRYLDILGLSPIKSPGQPSSIHTSNSYTGDCNIAGTSINVPHTANTTMSDASRSSNPGHNRNTTTGSSFNQHDLSTPVSAAPSNYHYREMNKRNGFESSNTGVGQYQYQNNHMDHYKTSSIRGVQSFIPKQTTKAQSQADAQCQPLNQLNTVNKYSSQIDQGSSTLNGAGQSFSALNKSQPSLQVGQYGKF